MHRFFCESPKCASGIVWQFSNPTQLEHAHAPSFGPNRTSTSSRSPHLFCQPDARVLCDFFRKYLCEYDTGFANQKKSYIDRDLLNEPLPWMISQWLCWPCQPGLGHIRRHRIGLAGWLLFSTPHHPPWASSGRSREHRLSKSSRKLTFKLTCAWEKKVAKFPTIVSQYHQGEPVQHTFWLPLRYGWAHPSWGPAT